MSGQDTAGGKWQTVKTKQQDVKKKRGPEPVAQSGRIEATDSVFSALDQWYDKKQDSHQKPAESSEVNDASSPSDAGSSTGESGVPKPPDVPRRIKKPKAKLAKITPSQAASGLDSNKISHVLLSVQQTYPHNQLSQLQTLGDHLLTTFQASELPFNKLLNEQYLEKVTDIPLQDLPLEVKHVLENFAAHLDVPVVSQFIMNILAAILETVPEANSKQSVPKAKVGLLIMLSLLLRTTPAALLLRSKDLLLGGKKYSGPNRLPLLLWLINQTARSNPAMGIAVWLRVLLPQIIGTQLPTVLQKTAPLSESAVLVMTPIGINVSLDYIQGLLNIAQEAPLQQQTNDHGFPEWHGGSANLCASNSLLHRLACIGLRYSGEGGTSIVEPVVPPAALDAIVRSQFTDSSHLQIAQRIKLLKQYEVLRELAFAGSQAGGFDCKESLRLALDTAVLSDGPYEGPGDETVDQAARNILACIAEDSQAAQVWETRHKQQLRGSTRVLQHLLHVYPKHFQPLLATAKGKAGLLKLLQSLRQRHQTQLQQGKGWTRTCAYASESASLALQKRVRNRGASLGWLLMFLLSLVLAAAALLTNKETQQAFHAFSDTQAGSQLIHRAQSVHAQLAPYLERISAQAAPIVGAIQVKVQPVAQQIQATLSSMFVSEEPT
ncbi:hypothetical protein ABBQ32_013852 [Trebouxia sp. C0010 RCD-2024]